MRDALEELVGTYRFHFSDDLRAHWRERLRLSEPGALEEAMATLEKEAASAQIEVTTSGHVVSRSGGEEFFRAALKCDDRLGFCFDKPNGLRVVLRRASAHELFADEPGKPEMRFERIR
jgi:hypothetical protein